MTIAENSFSPFCHISFIVLWNFLSFFAHTSGKSEVIKIRSSFAESKWFHFYFRPNESFRKHTQTQIEKKAYVYLSPAHTPMQIQDPVTLTHTHTHTHIKESGGGIDRPDLSPNQDQDQD